MKQCIEMNEGEERAREGLEVQATAAKAIETETTSTTMARAMVKATETTMTAVNEHNDEDVPPCEDKGDIPVGHFPDRKGRSNRGGAVRRSR